MKIKHNQITLFFLLVVLLHIFGNTHTRGIISQSLVASQKTLIKDDLRPKMGLFQSDQRAIKEFVKTCQLFKVRHLPPMKPALIKRKVN